MTDRSKKKVLVFVDWFDPAFKAGGPIRSCVNFVGHLHEDLDLYIFTSNKDLNATEPLTGIESDKWINYKNKAKVFYADEANQSSKKILAIINEVKPDYIYLNSFFSITFSIIPLWLKKINRIQTPVVLAPRGMLKKSALAFKPFKKKIFIRVFRILGIHKLIKFQATDQQELNDVNFYFPGAEVELAPNLPGAIDDKPTEIEKKQHYLKILFVGRVHPIKNLLFLLNVLQKSTGNIECSIIGMKEDESYWGECLSVIQSMPSSVKVNFMGEQEHHRIMEELDQHHIFALPTQGENFGHAIFEALSKGRPALISDQTPWRHLEQKKAGWDLSLSAAVEFGNSIKQSADWDQVHYNEWSNGAFNAAKNFIEQSSFKSSYLKLFN